MRMEILSQVIAFDIAVNDKTLLFQNPLLTKIMIVITTLFSPSILFLVSAILCFCLWYFKEKKSAALLATLLTTSAIITFALKHIIMRERPENMLLFESGYSFPSGHAIIATIFFCFIIHTFYSKIRRKLFKCVFLCTNTLLIFLVGLSRIYLQVHWLSDVLFGFMLGFFLVMIIFFILKKIIPRIIAKT